MIKYDTILNIMTPLGDSVELFIISRATLNSLVRNKETYKRVWTGFWYIDIYLLEEEKFAVSYTANGYGFIVEDKQSLNKIIRNRDYNTISLKRVNDEFYYAFRVNSWTVDTFLDEYKYEIDKKYNKVHRSHFDEDRFFKLAVLNEHGYLYFLERAENVYQGQWFVDERNFLYYFENDYAG